MSIEIQCKYCESQMKIEYKNLTQPTATIIVICPNCGAVGESFCESGLLNKSRKSFNLINNQLVMIAVLDAAEKAKVR